MSAFTPELRQRIASRLAEHAVLELDAPEARRAAVAIVVLPDDAGRPCFVLTRRQATLRRHRGQWAIPGGRLEPGESPVEAALRELHEEVGLLLSPDSVLGRLDDFLSRSGHLIAPIVMWSELASLTANPEEVKAVYRVPLSDLQHSVLEPLPHFDFSNSVGSTVFAPTAALLYQFREVALHGRPTRVSHFEQPAFAWQ